MIISPRFNDDEWLQYAFTVADDFTLHNDEHRIIMILFNHDQINIEQLSQRIQFYLRVRPYLVVGQHLFWKRLFHEMPTCIPHVPETKQEEPNPHNMENVLLPVQDGENNFILQPMLTFRAFSSLAVILQVNHFIIVYYIKATLIDRHKTMPKTGHHSFHRKQTMPCIHGHMLTHVHTH